MRRAVLTLAEVVGILDIEVGVVGEVPGDVSDNLIDAVGLA